MEIGNITTQSPSPTSSTGVKMTQLETQLEMKTTTDNKETLSKDKINDVIKSINEFLEPTYTSVQFELHEKLEEYFVVVIDAETKEVVREIPPKKLLDMYAAMTEFVGLVVDKKI
ncbi:flagellar protein FlaG [Cytobacillus sp. IB215665]|uniref:flagellar protein FlaG n=1 Tax=Cytobacillus sp. IB215665 TaxID=3097357 RepID=UPI002A1790C8|nr:flagellar protein FlaG [Cytobacillus sp. IB215665]MDX8363826.1 flagellar protein FlaG [Cytobacillus sp. IB215665]